MKKVIFFSKSLQIGGLERALVNLMNMLVAHFDVTLVLESISGELLVHLDPRVHLMEYRLSACHFVPLRKLFNFAKRMVWRLRYLNRFDFSCSYCTYSAIGSRLALYASENNCLYIHSDYSQVMSGLDYEAMYKTLRIEKFSKLFFVSNECRQAFLLHFPQMEKKCFTVNNLTDTEEILSLSRANVIDPFTEEQTVFVFVGRLEEETKCLSRLIKAFSMAREQRSDIRLIIVGGGKDENNCRKIISEFKLDNDVLMTGELINPFPYIKMADCLILASDQEGFPMVYYEAMLLGTAVITTVKVSDEAIDMRDYAIIAEKNASSIAAAMMTYQKETFSAPDIAAINQRRAEHICRLITDAIRA